MAAILIVEWNYDRKRFDYKNGGPCQGREFFSGAETIDDEGPVDTWRLGCGSTGIRGGILRELGRDESTHLCGAVQYRGQAARSSSDVFGESAEKIRNRIQGNSEEHIHFGFGSGIEETFLEQKFRTADRLRELLVLKASLPVQVPIERMILEFTPDEVDTLVSAAEVLKELYNFTQNRREEGIVAAADYVLRELGGVN